MGSWKRTVSPKDDDLVTGTQHLVIAQERKKESNRREHDTTQHNTTRHDMMMRLNVSALVMALVIAPALGQGISFPPGHADYNDIQSRSPGNTGNGGGIGAVLKTSAKNAGLGVASVVGTAIDNDLGDPISPDAFSSGIFQGYADSNNDRRKLQGVFDWGISNNLNDLTGKFTHALGTGVEKTSVDYVANAAAKTWHEHVPKAHFENLLGRKLLGGPQQ